MTTLTDDESKVLEVAERLERRREQGLGGGDGIVISELHLKPARYTQILMHLVQRPDVVADPRWTQLAYRIQRVMAANELTRSSRSFRTRTA